MSGRIALILAGLSVAASAATAQQPQPLSAAAEPDLKALADSCDARKFETLVVVDGSGRGKKVKICGKPGQTDAEWLVTLEDSARKIEADPQMAQAVKDQILAALKPEIEQLERSRAVLATAPVATIAVSDAPVTLPEAAPQYSSVPALPAPKPRSAAGKPGAALPPVARPRLTLRCALPSETFAACARLERESQLLIRADEDLPATTSLRFLRGGETRADVQLGALKKGESMREKLPGRVCAGVLRGKVEVQILNKGQVAETRGPFALYCGS